MQNDKYKLIKKWTKDHLEVVRSEYIDDYDHHIQYKQGFQDGAESALENVLAEIEKLEDKDAE